MTAPAASPRLRMRAANRWLSGWARDPMTIVGVFLLSLTVVVTFVIPLVYRVSPSHIDTSTILAGPTPTHPLGTDLLGRDLLARLASAGLIAIPMGIAAVGIGAVIGSIVGVAAGFEGGIFDAGIMRIVDAMLAFPTLLVSILIVAILGPGSFTAIVAVSIGAFPSYARVMRNTVLPLRHADFIDAARLSNASRVSILIRHVLRNVIDILIVLVVVGVGNGIIILAALSFLGVGVQPPQADWGVMLTDGVKAIYSAPLNAIAPAVLLYLTALGINLVGESLGRALRPDLVKLLRTV
jgi:peptide/nickel transport system permease protein